MLINVSRRLAVKYRAHTPVFLGPNPCADFNWIRNHSGLPWLHLSIQIPTDVILGEIPNISSYLSTHRDEYSLHHGWKSFCIHGKSWDATREDEYYQDDRPYTWTEEAEKHMPGTVEFFKNHWPSSSYQRIRLMLLEPGGYITVHTDTTQSRLSPINIAVTQPIGCEFVMEKYGTVPFVPGAAFWLDVSNRHVVFNDSDQPRWHIIVHQNCEHPNFQKMVVNSYHNLYNKHDETSDTDYTR